jgi:pimeloyl-ACP methyl ester carboxylesterase
MSKPTIVLVHGAFGDASSWRAVFDLLDGGDYTPLAAALPLRGLASDVAYLEAVIDQLEGPVILVGHSYGGCVITVAGVSDKVAALVRRAFVPDAGSRSATCSPFPASMGNSPQPRPLRRERRVAVIPTASGIFCADAQDVAAFMAHAQRPLWRCPGAGRGCRVARSRQGVLEPGTASPESCRSRTAGRALP